MYCFHLLVILKEKDALQAVKLDPTYKKGYLRASECALQRGDFASARNMYKHAGSFLSIFVCHLISGLCLFKVRGSNWIVLFSLHCISTLSAGRFLGGKKGEQGQKIQRAEDSLSAAVKLLEQNEFKRCLTYLRQDHFVTFFPFPVMSFHSIHHAAKPLTLFPSSFLFIVPAFMDLSTFLSWPPSSPPPTQFFYFFVVIVSIPGCIDIIPFWWVNFFCELN